MNSKIDPFKTALVLVDVQNDFFHAEGAMRRSGLEVTGNRSFIESLIKLCNACREAGILVVASSFTFIADTQNEPLIPPFIQQLNPKLIRGDFQENMWGHQIIEEVQPVNYVVKKIGPSAFFRTEMDIVLRHKEVKQIIIAGLNGSRSVVSTAYDALSLGLSPLIASDGTADYDGNESIKVLETLSGVFDVQTVSEIVARLTE